MDAAPRNQADRRRLISALLLVVAFMVAEVVAGLVAHSLALLSDAGHMLTDAAALALSLLAMQLAARPAAGGLTYGLKRAEILSGLANGVTLFVLAALIAFEAVHRLVHPDGVDARYMVGVAACGIVLNLLVLRQLARVQRRTLNVRGSYWHILTDLFAFMATAAAGGLILATGWARADAATSLLLAALMCAAAYALMKAAVLVLLEAAPADVSPDAVQSALEAHNLVVNVHDLHVWEITSAMPALSAHVLVQPGGDCHAVRRELEHVLAARFNIVHTTLQVDHAGAFPQLMQLPTVDSAS